jgi:hypothetical protein
MNKYKSLRTAEEEAIMDGNVTLRWIMDEVSRRFDLDCSIPELVKELLKEQLIHDTHFPELDYRLSEIIVQFMDWETEERAIGGLHNQTKRSADKVLLDLYSRFSKSTVSCF